MKDIRCYATIEDEQLQDIRNFILKVGCDGGGLITIRKNMIVVQCYRL